MTSIKLTVHTALPSYSGAVGTLQALQNTVQSLNEEMGGELLSTGKVAQLQAAVML